MTLPNVGVEIGDALRPRRSGMARYAQSLLDGLLQTEAAAQIQAWAPWRRVLGGIMHSPPGGMRYYGSTSPRNPPVLFHATACVFPKWKSSIEIATVHDLYGIPPRNEWTDLIKARTDYLVRSERLICVSEFTRRHVHELLGIDANRTVAIPLAPAAHFRPATLDAQRKLRSKFKLSNEFLLFVGRDRVNKNLDGLVTAYARSGLELPLCIAGRHSRATQERLLELARKQLPRGSLRWLGEVRDEQLPTLLSCASALCMPSTFEGFGLPVIEAMACGTPVLTSARCATEEAAGGHAVLIDPRDIDSMIEGLKRVLEVTQSRRDAAARHATARTWEHIARETWREYQQAL